MNYHYISAKGDMQPLEYKNIGSEKHLTFDSIRRLVLHELSELSEREASKHVQDCYRCKSIHQSLASPAAIRRKRPQKGTVPTMIGGLLLVVVLIGLAASFLFFGASTPPFAQQIIGSTDDRQLSDPSDDPEVGEKAAPVLEAIDTLSQINDEPAVEAPIATNKQFDTYIETQEKPGVRMRGIYGKITGNGQPLQGVTIMVPGSNKARVSDAGGKYYIQVPQYTRSLVFIYQGRQLTKQLDPTSRRLDIHLKTEEMAYPERNVDNINSGSQNIES